LIKAEAQGDKLFIKAEISKTEPLLWSKIKDGTLSKFSIRGRILDAAKQEDAVTKKEILVIKGMELHEVSVVSVPANPAARSLAWYVEKAMAELDKAVKPKHYPFDQCMSDRKAAGYDDKAAAAICGAIKARTISHMVEWGMAKTEEEAIEMVSKKYESDPVYAYAWQKFLDLAGGADKAEGVIKDLNEGNLGVMPGPGNANKRSRGQLSQAQKNCVGTHIREGMRAGKPHDQAIAYAYSACKVNKEIEPSGSVKEFFEDLVANLPELETLANEIEQELKTEKGGDEVETQKNQEHLMEAIKAIQEAIPTLKGEAKDQAEAVLRSLEALNVTVYGNAKKDGEGEDDVEKAKKAKMKAEEDMKTKKAAEDAAADAQKSLEKLIGDLQAQVKDGLEKTQAETAKMEAVKADIEKQVASVVAALEKLPIRKGQGTGEDIDRSGEGDKDTIAGLAKSVKAEKGFEKLGPGDQLHRLLATFTGERKVK